jgi:hypothetical protein
VLRRDNAMRAITFPLRLRVAGLAHRAHIVASGLVGIATFVACITYMVAHFGWFHGIAIGWLPSLFFAAVASYLWPALGLAAVLMSLMRNT